MKPAWNKTYCHCLSMCCSAFLSLVCANAMSSDDVAEKATAVVPSVPEAQTRLLEERHLTKGAAEQGLALTAEHYFTSTAHSICRFDTEWKLLEK